MPHTPKFSCQFIFMFTKCFYIQRGKNVVFHLGLHYLPTYLVKCFWCAKGLIYLIRNNFQVSSFAYLRNAFTYSMEKNVVLGVSGV